MGLFVTEGELKPFNGMRIEVKLEDDQGDPDQARDIATKIIAKNDSLMVIGHNGSTQTRAALAVYLRTEPPVPVILTTETSPNLTPPKLKPTKRFPILRLSPNDTQQAKSAVNFLERTSAKAIWVVEDVDRNHVYSDYLASEFTRQVQTQNRSVLLLTDNMHLPTARAFDELKIDWVFFAGGSDHALVLIRQLQRMSKTNKPGILLTDASAHHELIDEGGQDVEGVYLTYPMKAQQYNSRYAIYGAMARDVTDYLIESAQNTDFSLGFGYEWRQLLGIHRVYDARRLLAAQIEQAQNTRMPFIMTNELTKEMSLEFGVGNGDEDGTRTDRNARFEVWQVCGGEFTDVDLTRPTTQFTSSCPKRTQATARD